MYDNFAFNKRNNEITGYKFDCENPTHVVCLIHGIGEHAGRYKRVADKLAEKHIAVVSMDLRGHGISSGPRGHGAPRSEVLKDVDALIEYAQNTYPGVPIILYGHSMGGNICLDYKYRGSKNDIPCKYIVSAPWVELVRPVSKPLYGVLSVMSKVAPRMTMSSACNEADLGNLKNVRPYKDDPLVHDKISFQCAKEGFDIGKALAKGTLPNNHGSDGKPFLLMHGDADKICSVEGSRKIAQLNKGKPGFTYKEWPGYYHEIHNGCPDATGDDVIEKIINFILN